MKGSRRTRLRSWTLLQRRLPTKPSMSHAATAFQSFARRSTPRSIPASRLAYSCATRTNCSRLPRQSSSRWPDSELRQPFGLPRHWRNLLRGGQLGRTCCSESRPAVRWATARGRPGSTAKYLIRDRSAWWIPVPMTPTGRLRRYSANQSFATTRRALSFVWPAYSIGSMVSRLGICPADLSERLRFELKGSERMRRGCWKRWLGRRRSRERPQQLWN